MTTASSDEGTVYLPRFSRRVRALWIDAVVLIALYLLWIVSLEWQLALPPAVRVATLVLPIALVEPAMVAWTGGSIGHHALHLRVQDAADGRRLGFPRACLRAVLKTALGWLSLAFALFSDRRQALHDSWTRSWVVVAKPERVATNDRVSADSLPTASAPVNVPVARRLGVIVAWWLVATVVYAAAMLAILLPLCDTDGRCPPGPTAVTVVFDVLWWCAMASIPALGWFGRLYGARARPSA